MPAKGERRTVNGVTGEFDGTGWVRVDAAPAEPAAPAVGSRRTVDGITGEWDGQGWRRVADKSVGEFALNAIDSGANLIKGSVEGVGLIGKMADAALKGGVPYFTDPQLRDMMQGATKAGVSGLAKGAKEYFANRYGGLNEIGETLYKDPFGVAADASTVLSLGGAGAARLPGTAGRVGASLARAGAAIDPIAQVSRGVTAATPRVVAGLERGGEALADSALDVSRALQKRNPTVNFGRALASDEGLLLTKGGARKLASRTGTDEAQIGNLIENSTARVGPETITEPLRELAANKRALAPGSSLRAEAPQVDQRVNEIFRSNYESTIPVQDVQATKVALNQRLRNTFGTMSGEPAVNLDIQHAERRGMMRGVEEAVPEVKPINERLGRRYALDEAMEQALARQKTPVTLANAPVKALTSPIAKTLYARELFRMGRNAGRGAATFEASAPVLTRLAVMSQLAPEEP